MSRVAVTFKEAWGQYNKGETAGFGAVTAGKLIKAGVAKSFDPEALDAAAASGDVDARLAALELREAEIAAREQAIADAQGGAGASEPEKGTAKGAGAPPKQGGK